MSVINISNLEVVITKKQLKSVIEKLRKLNRQLLFSKLYTKMELKADLARELYRDEEYKRRNKELDTIIEEIEAGQLIKKEENKK